MSRTKSHFQKKEPLLEKFLQVLRFRKVIPYIRKGNKILDLGCGYNGALLDKLSSKISEGVGIDISVTNQKKANNIKLISRKIGGNIYLPRNHFDLVACLALLEHLESPLDLLKTAYRTMKKNGCIVISTPSPAAKPILEFLAYRLGVISKQEIRDHKKYYDEAAIKSILVKAGFKTGSIVIKYFTFGLNTFAVARK